MRCLPDRMVESIRIYRAATDDDDPDDDNYFDDPFAPEGDPYSESDPIRSGYTIAEGKALSQSDRLSIYRRTERVDVGAIAFFNHFFVIRSLDREIPVRNYGSLSDDDRLYLWRLKELPNIINRHTIVYAEPYPNGFLFLYTTDEREGSRTFRTL